LLLFCGAKLHKKIQIRPFGQKLFARLAKNRSPVWPKTVHPFGQKFSPSGHKNRSKLFSHSGADFVVFNDLSEITSEKHPFEIFNKNGDCVCKGGTNKELGEKLDKILNQTQINADAHR